MPFYLVALILYVEVAVLPKGHRRKSHSTLSQRVQPRDKRADESEEEGCATSAGGKKQEQPGGNVAEPQRVTFPMLQLERASTAGGP